MSAHLDLLLASGAPCEPVEPFVTASPALSSDPCSFSLHVSLQDVKSSLPELL